jgi:hypothetical protein
MIKTIKVKPVGLFLRLNDIASLKVARKCPIPMVQFGVNELLFLIIICLHYSVCYFNREPIKIATSLAVMCTASL